MRIRRTPIRQTPIDCPASPGLVKFGPISVLLGRIESHSPNKAAFPQWLLRSLRLGKTQWWGNQIVTSLAYSSPSMVQQYPLYFRKPGGLIP
jgi:hypothetical protein